MSTKSILSVIAVLIILGVGSLAFFKSPRFHNLIMDAWNSGEEADTVREAHQYFVVKVADGSGSGSTTYNVPRVELAEVSADVDSIFAHGGGRYWLTYIDREALNNDVASMAIPAIPEAPRQLVRGSGEIPAHFAQRKRDYTDALAHHSGDSARAVAAFTDAKTAFLQEADRILSLAYQKKGRTEDYSDVEGAVAASERLLNNFHAPANKLAILLVSDGVQSDPAGTPKKKHGTLPADITLYLINRSGSEQSIADGHAVQVDNAALCREMLFR